MFESFKQHPLYLRKEQANRIFVKYPSRIPVILEKYFGATNAPDIDKNKFLVPTDISVGSFSYIIRRRLKMNEKEALFLFCNNTIPPTAEWMSDLYHKHKDEDGFLYMSYTTENTFG